MGENGEVLEQGEGEESVWAKAIGPVYSEEGMAEMLETSLAEVVRMRDEGQILSLPTREGDYVYPAYQLTDEKEVVPGLHEVLTTFVPGTISEYTFAAWLTNPRNDLFEGSSAITWSKEHGPDDKMMAVIREMARGFAQ